MSAHLLYVAACYAAAVVTVAALVGWVVLDGQARQRDLARLEEAGIRRRSAGKAAS